MPETVHPPAANDSAALRAWLAAEIARPFAGWDFSALHGRWREGGMPIDYRSIVGTALAQSTALLDMGTGGGEFLAGLAPLPAVVCATEGYPPNLPIARARLAPLGVVVLPVAEDDPGALPFADAAFDLIINRHEYYDPREVWRTLRPTGRFITQQVGGENYVDLPRALGAPENRAFAGWHLAAARADLEAVGFTITHAAEAFPPLHFRDVGTLAYYLTAIPWEVPDFTVERYFPRLQALQRHCETAGAIVIRQHRFLLVGERPAR
jgi:SAM-dependent methyltransferase